MRLCALFFCVMPGLEPGIHDFARIKTWLAELNPVMTGV